MIPKKNVLYKIYQAKAKMSVFDLLYELGIEYQELKPILDEYVENRLLTTEDGKFYTFVGDGRMFSGKFQREGAGQRAQNSIDPFAFGINGKKKSECISNDNSEEEGETFMRQRKAYLEARRAELFQSIREAINYNDDNDGSINDEEGDEEDFCDGIFCSIKDNFSVEKEQEKYIISVFGLDLGETDAKFELIQKNGKVYLCDQGATFFTLEETFGLNDDIREKVKKLVVENRAELMEDNLCVEVLSADRTLSCLFRLYAVMERVLHMESLAHP